MTDQDEKNTVSPSLWLTIGEAAELAGEQVPARTIRWAALHKFIPGATKRGRDWQIPKQAFLHWLGHRPKPGRKTKED